MTESRAQLLTLARATFSSFFQSELVAPGLPQVRLVIFAIVALMFPATQVPPRAFSAYNYASKYNPDFLDLLMWPHKLLFITTAMVGTAVVSLIIWDNVFPDRRDAYIIGPLPMRTRTVVGGRLLALGALMSLIALGTALPSAILYGFVAGVFSPGGIVRSVVAHFVATMGASMFAFLLLLCLQGMLINLFPGRWLQRAMVVLQFVFVVASLETLLFMHSVIAGLEKAITPATAAQAGWMSWTPPAWFLGIYQVIAGTTRPVARFAVPAVIGLGILFPLAFGLYAFTYQRLTRRAIESRDAERVGRAGRDPFLAAAGAALTRSSIAAAVCRFAVITLLRGRRHRLLLTLFAGVGTTAAAMGMLIQLDRNGSLESVLNMKTILPIGFVFVFFLIVGLRTMFAIPAEPAANWVFKLSDAEDARLHVRGAIAAMVSLGALPVVLVLAAIHLFVLGPAMAAVHSALLLASGYLLAEIVLKGFRRVPFTSVYAPQTSRARVMWPFWLIGYLVFSGGLSTIELALIERGPLAWTMVAAVGSAALVLRLAREWEYRLAPRMLTFDEDEEDALVTLELSGAVPVPTPRP